MMNELPKYQVTENRIVLLYTKQIEPLNEHR